MPAPAAPTTPEWEDWDTTATYISTLNVDGTNYTIKDTQARANITANKYDIELLKKTVAGGVHFRGITVTAITDGESGKTLYDKDGNSWPQPGLEVENAQQVGDIFIYNNGTKNLEFVVVAVENEGHTSYSYSELGSTGTLRAMAFCDTASGSTTVPLSSNFGFNTFTPDVSKGTLAVTTSSVTLSLSSTATAASVTVGNVTVTVPAASVAITPTTSTFAALADVTYDSGDEKLTLTSVTSAAYWTGVTSAQTASVTAGGAGPTVGVTYDKASMTDTSVLTSGSLTGDLSVTGAKPTATITNPTITVTVSPNAAS